MKNKKFDVIVCPHCGRQYLPSEIFIPDVFFGTPIDVLRDEDGKKILDVFGTTMNTNETYMCDGCNTEFEVSTKIQFIANETKTANFDEEFATSIHKDTITLSEES